MQKRFKFSRHRYVIGVAVLVAAVACYFGQAEYFVQHQPPLPAISEALFPGVVFERVVQSSPRPLVWQTVRIDLQTPGLRFLVTPPDRNSAQPLNARLTSVFMSERGAQLAVNGDFFHPFHAPNRWNYYPHAGDPVSVEGRDCSEGVWYGADKDHERIPALFLTQNNRAFIGNTPPKELIPYNVVSGNALFLKEGKLQPHIDNDLQPRTAAGLDAKARFLWLLVIDGRQTGYSEGASGAEVARFLKSRGCSVVLNLDGGGSATLAIQQGGRPEILNRPIHVYVPGRERPVANHLAVFLNSPRD